MNIFVVDEDPVIAAQSLCDKHVVKMILESGEMLCHAINSTGATSFYDSNRHKNHPCTIWTRTSRQNWKWLHTHALALCDEYTLRYHKTHKWDPRLRNLQCPNLPDIGLTPFARAIKYKQYPELLDTSITDVEAYRRYYRIDKARFAKWRTSPPPWW